jgi:hypothetical protein
MDGCVVCPDELSKIQLSANLQPMGIAITPLGALLLTCWLTGSLYAVQPLTGECERVAGTGTKLEVELDEDEGVIAPKEGPALSVGFTQPCGVVVSVEGRCAFVADSGTHCIRRVTLPAHLFPPDIGEAFSFLCSIHSSVKPLRFDSVLRLTVSRASPCIGAELVWCEAQRSSTFTRFSFCPFD